MVSMVVQRLRIWLAMQGTPVRSLVRDDPACQGAAELVCHKLMSLCSGPHKPQLLTPHPTTPEACVP